jgi:hypothetical protein
MSLPNDKTSRVATGERRKTPVVAIEEIRFV